jgi:hypothetical protein
MAVKTLHQIFYYHSKYLNSMKCREISMGPSIRTIQCSSLSLLKKRKEKDHGIFLCISWKNQSYQGGLYSTQKSYCPTLKGAFATCGLGNWWGIVQALSWYEVTGCITRLPWTEACLSMGKVEVPEMNSGFSTIRYFHKTGTSPFLWVGKK